MDIDEGRKIRRRIDEALGDSQVGGIVGSRARTGDDETAATLRELFGEDVSNE